MKKRWPSQTLPFQVLKNLEKFKDLDDRAEIIGPGFYSAFMVAEKVTVISRSYKGKAIQWESEGKTEYTLLKRRAITEHTFAISEEGQITWRRKIQGLLTTYCKFMPVPIVFGENTVEEGEGEKNNGNYTKSNQ